VKILKITTHWTPEEADCIYQLLDDFKQVLWQCYGEDIVQMHKTVHAQQQERYEEKEPDDELLF
jgi:hypothetical protein